MILLEVISTYPRVAVKRLVLQLVVTSKRGNIFLPFDGNSGRKDEAAMKDLSIRDCEEKIRVYYNENAWRMLL